MLEKYQELAKKPNMINHVWPEEAWLFFPLAIPLTILKMTSAIYQILTSDLNTSLLIFSNHFILVRVAVKLKLIPGPLISIILYYIHFFSNFKFKCPSKCPVFKIVFFYNSHILIETLEINCFFDKHELLSDYLPAAGKNFLQQNICSSY